MTVYPQHAFAPGAVVPVRTFKSTRKELGAMQDGDFGWFVYDREIGMTEWHKHCGPYSTFQSARDWILDIREV